MSTPAPALTKLGMDIDEQALVYRRGDKVLRAIRPGFEPFFRELLTRPCIVELIAEGRLIGTAVSGEAIEGHSLVLEHPCLPFINYPFEWTPTMFQAAVAAILELNIRLMENGLHLNDGHPWNIVFDGPRPVFIDFSSIAPLGAEGRWGVIEEFDASCMNALRIMAKGFPDVARALLRDSMTWPDWAVASSLSTNPRITYAGRSPLAADVMRAGEQLGKMFGKALTRVKWALVGRPPRAPEASVEALRGLLAEVRAMDVRPPCGEWSHYYTGPEAIALYDGNTVSGENQKEAVIAEILARLRPATVLDIACNRGLFSRIAAEAGARVVGIDTDEFALDQMARDVAAHSLPIIPLVVNAVAPAEGIGFKEMPLLPVGERLRADCVLCLALVHHLVLKRSSMSFAHIAKLLASYARRQLIVEFVPREDHRYVETWIKKGVPWYSLENFEAALRVHFPHIERFASHPAPRVLLLCEK